MTQSLRDRHKQHTRQAISDAATRLFLDRGFERVTIADVAAAAGVAKMTVTNHFPRKEDLVLDIHEDLVTSLAAAVTARATGEPALTALRRHYLDGLARREAELGFAAPGFARLITESAPLRARLREIREQQEEALAQVLAAETGARDLTPRVAAAQFGGVYRVLFAEVVARTAAGAEPAAIQRAMRRPARRAFDLLEPGLGAYAVKDG